MNSNVLTAAGYTGLGLLIAVGVIWGAAPQHKYTAEEIMDADKNSIVLIENQYYPMDISPIDANAGSAPAADTGTGFFISPDEILTNYHVVRQSTFLRVKFPNSDEFFDVKVKDFNENADFAVLTPVDKDLFKKHGGTPLNLYKGGDVRSGENVYAIGEPLGFENTVTQGIVGNPKRAWPKHHGYFIQTDAKILPGNSGGPLINSKNEVIGINSFLMGPGHEVGFSLPSDHILKFLKDFAAHRPVQYPLLGISFKINENNISVDSLAEDSKAKEAGMLVGDIIDSVTTKYNSIKTTDVASLRNEISVLSPGDKVTLHVTRNKKPMTFVIDPQWKDWVGLNEGLNP